MRRHRILKAGEAATRWNELLFPFISQISADLKLEADGHKEKGKGVTN